MRPDWGREGVDWDLKFSTFFVYGIGVFKRW